MITLHAIVVSFNSNPFMLFAPLDVLFLISVYGWGSCALPVERLDAMQLLFDVGQ